MENQNKISVIITQYQNTKTVNDSLRSVLTALAKAKMVLGHTAQIIVVDDCSERPFVFDETFPKDGMEVLRLSKNSGVAIARNRGVSKASSKYVHILDADVFIDEDFYLELVKILENYPNRKIYQGRLNPIPFNEKPNSFESFLGISFAFDEKINCGKDGEAGLLTSGCFIVDKDFYFEVGGFSEKFNSSGGEEFDFLRNLPSGQLYYYESLGVSHYYESFLPRMRKVIRRSLNYGEVVGFNGNFPLLYKLEVFVRMLFSLITVAALIFSFWNPMIGLGICLFLTISQVFIDGGQRFIYLFKHGGFKVSLLSLFYQQVEYFVACIGSVVGLVLPKSFYQKKTGLCK